MPTASGTSKKSRSAKPAKNRASLDFDIVPIDGVVMPFDVDVHEIPARYDADGQMIEDAHEHHDIRFLLIADADDAIQVSDESHDVAWFTPDEVRELTDEESVLRMLHKALSLAWLNRKCLTTEDTEFTETRLRSLYEYYALNVVTNMFCPFVLSL